MKRNERVSHIMSNDPITVSTQQKLHEVSQIMVENKIHHVPVVSGDKLIGMISATDLARATYEYGVDGRMTETVLDHTRTIEDMMQPGLVTVTPTDTIRSATEILAQNWFHAIPVVEGDTLVGIVTTTDLLKYLLDQF